MLPKLWSSFHFTRRSHPMLPDLSKTLDSLNNDIMLYLFSTFFDISDVLCMRAVSKRYYYLTHEASLWKRFLRYADIPLHPLPPTSRHNVNNITNMEAERLLTRAYSIQKEWLRPKPKVYNWMRLHTAHRIISMVLLPGSHYLVATLADDTYNRFYIEVYVMDHPIVRVGVLARVPAETKAYHLRARYMTIEGHKGIVIAYIRHDFRHRAERTHRINVSEFNADFDIDSPVELKYECIVLFISLLSLEILGNPALRPGSEEFIEHARAQPPPFRRLCLIRSTRKLSYPSLDELNGIPYISVVRRPDNIIFKPLVNGSTRSVLVCKNRPEMVEHPHDIIAMRVIPPQNQVLVVRKVSVPPPIDEHPLCCLEYFDIPLSESLSAPPLEVTQDSVDMNPHLFNYDVVGAHITELGIPAAQFAGAVPQAPPPIHIFVRAINPNSLWCVTIHPTPLEAQSGPMIQSHAVSYPAVHRVKYTHVYPMPEEFPLKGFLLHSESSEFRVIPGAHRTIAYTVESGQRSETQRIIAMYRYSDPDCGGSENLELVQLQDFPIGEKHVAALAWDESIGRLCIAHKGDSMVWMADYSQAPFEDQYGRYPIAVYTAPVDIHCSSDLPYSE